MDKYEVLGTLGEGSFGRVYQAKQISNSSLVALKVISKRGRSQKELKGFRRECEIQRELHHPNIIQMLDSFETENEIVVITEFAHKELTKVLGKENYLPEERVQLIVWDLVSALYYLHSNRVLHRDLKPQNILLDQKNRAKLCDFGFARNMSTGTHVLTSIKVCLNRLNSYRKNRQNVKPRRHLSDAIEWHSTILESDNMHFDNQYTTLIATIPLVGIMLFSPTKIVNKLVSMNWLSTIYSTPLYMAPELIDEQPYDYTADLWSLGCIIYELLMGTPPFCTSSILRLIRMIRHGQIQWPTFLSESCISFLKGLLQKNPSRRLTWEEILNHPFVKGHILISKNTTVMPLTEPLTASVLEVKEKQKKDSISNKQTQMSVLRTPDTSNKSNKKTGSSKSSGGSQTSEKAEPKSSSLENKNINSKDVKAIELLTCDETNLLARKEEDCKDSKSSNTNLDKLTGSAEMNIKEEHTDAHMSKCIKEQLNFIEDDHPIEAEEWIVFLQRSIQEVMLGEMTSLMQANLTNVVVTPLRNSNTTSKVLTFVARLLSIPFVVKGTSERVTAQIKQVYLEVKLVPNLVYASKLLLRQQIKDDVHSLNSPSPSSTPSPLVLQTYKGVGELCPEDLQAIEYIYLLICHLVHCQDDFLIQFCDSVVILNVYVLMKMFLGLAKIKLRIVLDVMAILTQTLRKLPENKEIIEKILLDHTDNESVNLVELLRHSDPTLRERTCYFLLFVNKHFQKEELDEFWNDGVKETLEALMFDSIESVRNAAQATVAELKSKNL